MCQGPEKPTVGTPRGRGPRKEGKAGPGSCPEPKRPLSSHPPDRGPDGPAGRRTSCWTGGSRGGTEQAFVSQDPRTPNSERSSRHLVPRKVVHTISYVSVRLLPMKLDKERDRKTTLKVSVENPQYVKTLEGKK